METNDFLNTIYDLIANNPIDNTIQMSHNEVIEMVDGVDFDRKAIMFIDNKGVHHELQLVSTFAPKPEKLDLQEVMNAVGIPVLTIDENGKVTGF